MRPGERRASPPCLAAVDNVVMNQGGKVDQLQGAGHLNRLFLGISENFSRKQYQPRSDPLALHPAQLRSHVSNQRNRNICFHAQPMAWRGNLGYKEVSFVFVFVEHLGEKVPAALKLGLHRGKNPPQPPRRQLARLTICDVQRRRRIERRLLCWRKRHWLRLSFKHVNPLSLNLGHPTRRPRYNPCILRNLRPVSNGWIVFGLVRSRPVFIRGPCRVAGGQSATAPSAPDAATPCLQRPSGVAES